MRAEVALSFTLKAETCRPVTSRCRWRKRRRKNKLFHAKFLTKNLESSTDWTGDLKAICQQQQEWRWRLLLPWLPGSLVLGVLVIGLGQWNYSNYLEKDFTVRCRQAITATKTRIRTWKRTAKDGPDDCSSYRLALVPFFYRATSSRVQTWSCHAAP